MGKINLTWQQLWEIERVIEFVKPIASRTMQGELVLESGTKVSWEFEGLKIEFFGEKN